MKFVIAAVLCASLAWSQPVNRPRITGVAHIALYAHDLDQSRAFYTGFLGFQEPYSLKNGDGSLSMAFFKIDDRQYVELIPETQVRLPARPLGRTRGHQSGKPGQRHDDPAAVCQVDTQLVVGDLVLQGHTLCSVGPLVCQESPD